MRRLVIKILILFIITLNFTGCYTLSKSYYYVEKSLDKDFNLEDYIYIRTPLMMKI